MSRLQDVNHDEHLGTTSIHESMEKVKKMNMADHQITIEEDADKVGKLVASAN